MEETIGYSGLQESIEEAKNIKALGFSFAEAFASLKVLDNIQTIHGSPDIDPKNPGKYVYDFQPFYIYTKDRESLESILLAMFRYNDKMLLLKSIKTGGVLYQQLPSKVSVVNLDWFKCPWGNRQIVKFQDSLTNQFYWAVADSVR